MESIVDNSIRDALEAAERFISNGVEFGYIQMPDADTPDPAHYTLPRIRAALAALEQQDKDWLAMLRAIARIADAVDPTNEWSEADDATLAEQFDPWQALREAENKLVEMWDWYVCDIDNKSNLITRAQFRGITVQGYVLMRQRPAPAASESQESVFSRAASGIALAALRQAHERGETISIPSLGIEIPPFATAAGEE